MNDPTRVTMDIAERRAADRALSERRRAARMEYVEQSQLSADFDADYRKVKAARFIELRAAGEPQESAKIQAEAFAADSKHSRDIAASLAKAALLKIDETERDGVSVRDIHRVSTQIDGVAP